MKHLLFFAISLLSLTAGAQTSVYFPFPTDSAHWCANFCFNMANSLSQTTDRLNGKVLINGIEYSRMEHYEHYCTGAGLCVCGQETSHDTATYFLRQDVAQKKVWIYEPGTNSDITFLDFNLQVGDTIDSRRAYWARALSSGEYAVVSSIDSIQIGNQYRKRINYTYQSFPANALIEGVGPTHGLFYICNKGYDYATSLEVFAQNQQLLIPYFAADTTSSGYLCYDATNGLTEPSGDERFGLFPNPSNGHCSIYLGTKPFDGSLEVYNATGSLIRHEQIQAATTRSMDLTGFNSGIYLIKVSDGRRTSTRHLVLR